VPIQESLSQWILSLWDLSCDYYSSSQPAPPSATIIAGGLLSLNVILKDTENFVKGYFPQNISETASEHFFAILAARRSFTAPAYSSIFRLYSSEIPSNKTSSGPAVFSV